MSTSSLFLRARGAAAWTRPARFLLAGALAALLSLGACGGNDGDDVDRGPTEIPVTAKPNGLYWDSAESRLYLTDDDTNAIKVWDGKQGFSVAATLTPPPASGPTLGQLTRDAGGSFYVTRFGFGQHGNVVVVPASGAAYELAGLDPQRRRIGLARTPDGKLLVGWFRGGRSGGDTGTISELSVQGNQGSERELVTGLGKPAGLAVVGDQLFVTDQNTAQLLVYSLSAVRAQPATAQGARVVASFLTSDQLDLMTAAADGTLYFGGNGGSLYQVNPNGEVRTLATGWGRVRGVALDERHRRLFVIDAAAQTGDASRIRIVPIDWRPRRAGAAPRARPAGDGTGPTIVVMVERALSARAMGYAQADKRIEILQLVALHGSISQAAREAGISYKAAWQAIHTLTNLAGEPLVDSSVGGAGGGGACLTAAGTRLLHAAAEMDAARRDVLARINDPSARLLGGPRTSMRNHLRGAVERLESAGARDPMVRVVLALTGGAELASLVTRESAELLSLMPGQPVLALCKATAVRVQAAQPDDQGSAGANLLAGRVLRVSRGLQRDEITVTLAGGMQLVGFAVRPNRLRAGSRAAAWLDESAVVLALAV